MSGYIWMELKYEYTESLEVTSKLELKASSTTTEETKATKATFKESDVSR